MAARITYNSNNVDITVVESFDVYHRQERSQGVTSTGIIQTINQHGIYEVELHCFFQTAVERQLQAWWSWARQGKVFSVARDSGDVGNTTLDGAAAAAQKVIPLTATASFSAGDECIIEAADNDDEFEVVTIDSKSAGVSVTADLNLNYTYASGDTFRHRYYFPAMKTLDDNFRPRLSGEWYEHTFRFVEDKS